MVETKTMKGLSFIKRDTYQRTLKSGENVWSSIYRTRIGNDKKDFMFHIVPFSEIKKR